MTKRMAKNNQTDSRVIHWGNEAVGEMPRWSSAFRATWRGRM